YADDLRIRRSGRVEPSAETGFEYREFDLCFGECEQSNSSHVFKKCRAIFKLSVREKFFRGVADTRRDASEIGVGNIIARDLYAFGYRNKMRRRIKPCADAGFAAYCVQKRADRAFAVRPGDLHLRKIRLRRAKFLQE